FVGERRRVEVGAGQPVSFAAVPGDCAVRAISNVQHPACIVAARVGVEDSRQREAQLGEATFTADGTETSNGDGTAVAVQRRTSSAGATERNAATAKAQRRIRRPK